MLSLRVPFTSNGARAAHIDAGAPVVAMSASLPTDVEARAVLAEYFPDRASAKLTCLENGDGFSGASIWRVDLDDSRCLCLKAWAPGEPSMGRLTTIHRWMDAARAAGLCFVPSVQRPRVGEGSCVAAAGRLWDLTQWMPGTCSATPTTAEVSAACAALAHLHCVWQRVESAVAPCTAVEARLQRWRLIFDLVEGGWSPASSAEHGELGCWTRRGWLVLKRHAKPIGPALSPWTRISLPLQPCLCDIRAEHVLFDQTRVSGIVDFGAARLDNVSVDVARLLGTLAGDVADLRAAGLAAYESVRRLSFEEKSLVHYLDRTGAVLAVAGWLMWLHEKGRSFSDRPVMLQRLKALVERIEAWPRLF